jgi:hypothetical protein
MSASISLLSSPHPCRHIVYPYTDEDKAINAVHLFANSGLGKGESVVLIMSDLRCEAIKGRLAQGGIDVAAQQAGGRLKCLSADSMLCTFLRGGVLNDRLVTDTLARVIDKARESSPSRRVRVFGEMVSLLLARNEAAVAEHLEELWNGIIESRSISLLCTYALLDSGYATLPETIAKLHTHSIDSWFPDTRVAAQGTSAND